MTYYLWGIWGEKVICNVILVIRNSFNLQIQDGRKLHNFCRFDLFYIIIEASLILPRISFQSNDNSNENDNDTITSSSSSSTTTTSVWNIITNLFLNFHGCSVLGMNKKLPHKLYDGCNFLSVPGVKLIHISKRNPLSITILRIANSYSLECK